MRIKTFIEIIFILLLTGMSAYAGDVTYQGRVIDADTKEPIEGVVVVAMWNEERAAVAGPDTRLKDVKETLTDKNGEWSIVGPEGERHKIIPGLLQLIGVYMTREPTFIVFKPGYCSYPQGFSIDACKGKIKPGGDLGFIRGETTELPKLTKREDRLKAQAIWPSLMDGDKEMHKKIINFIKLKSEERKNLGLRELSILKELENEK